MSYSPEIVDKLNEIAHRYQDLIHQSIHAVLISERYRNTGAGAASLVIEVIDGSSDHAPQIRITFDDYLIFLDKRKIQWTKLPKMQELIKWAETVKPTKKEAVQLAWAVGWDKKKNDTWKAKPWRKKSLSGVLREMNEMIVSMYDQVLEAELAEAWKK